MKTRSNLLLFLLLFLTVTAHSQYRNHRNSKDIFISVLAGGNISRLNGTDESGGKLDNSFIPGFHGGISSLIRITSDFYFEPGLMFTTKGARRDIDLTPVKGEATAASIFIRTSYAEIPMVIVYRPELGNGYLLLGAGGYLAYGIGGNVRIKSDYIEESTIGIIYKNKVADTDPEEKYYLKPFDAGAEVFAGYELAMGLYFRINAQAGFLKINPEYDGEAVTDESVKNIGFGFTAGYRF